MLDQMQRGNIIKLGQRLAGEVELASVGTRIGIAFFNDMSGESTDLLLKSVNDMLPECALILKEVRFNPIMINAHQNRVTLVFSSRDDYELWDALDPHRMYYINNEKDFEIFKVQDL